jgi:multicomponent K+:H+ antiporter subunit D
MSLLADHLVILPILLPLVAGALLIPLDERRRGLKAAVSLAATVATLAVTVILLRLADAPVSGVASSTVTVYQLGDWPAPFGIVLVLDRLSAMMLVLAGILALATLVFSLARWQGAGSHFHSLFLFLLMGLNGTFLTGDLFNLFVFFEILLAASYGLVLHGSGLARVRAGLHYIAVNLGASSLFLIGVSLIYAVTGTLNMADIVMRASALAGGDKVLFETGAAILGVAFLVKAGIWPLGFWLPGAYAAAAPPMAAFFVVLTKVGIYIILRLSLLMAGAEGAAAGHFGGGWLIAGGMMTVVFGAVGILASQDLARLASYSVAISSGTLLAMIGTGDAAVTGGALFYLVSSTLATCAFFMLVELIERGRAAGADVLAVTMEAYGEAAPGDQEEEEIGVAIPATMAILGGSFVCCAVLIAGLPPLSGFVAKFLLLGALLAQPAAGGGVGAVGATSWALIALLLLSGFAAIIAMARAGIRSFWLPLENAVPRVRLIEIAPVVALLLLCVALTVEAAGAMRFIQAATGSPQEAQGYIRAVLPPAPPGEAPEAPQENTL